MALVPLPTGLPWPIRMERFMAGNTPVMDASGEKFAMIGKLHINGRPAGTKTLDTSGSSSIGFQLGANPVFDDAGSSCEIGIQGVGTTGPTAQPDGTFSVKAVVTLAANTTPALTTTNAWAVAIPTTGTVTLAHGDLIAVVIDFVTRAGTDSLNVTAGSPSSGAFFPVTNAFAAAAWGATGVGGLPNCVLTFSDGTLGTLDGCAYVGLPVTEAWADASDPDERGNIFQVPFDCKVDALWCAMRSADATSDFTLALYSDAEGAATSLASVAVDAAQAGAVNQDLLCVVNLPSEIALSKNVDYCVAAKATGAGNIRWQYITLGDAAHRAFFHGGVTMRGVTRNAGAGAFGSSSTVTIRPVGVRISQLDDGTGAGAGGGLLVNPGMRGGMS